MVDNDLPTFLRVVIYLTMIFFACALLLVGCSSFQYPVPMPDGTVAYAKYRNFAQNRTWTVELDEEGRIKALRLGVSNDSADKALEAVLKAAILAAGVGK